MLLGFGRLLELSVNVLPIAFVLHRQHELEARAVGLRVLVDEIAVVGACVRACDRQAQPGAADALAAAPGEALEQLGNELRRHALAVMARRTLGWAWQEYRAGEG